MIKVLHVIRNMGQGGTEKFLINVLKNMKNESITHIIASYGDISEWEKDLKKWKIKVVKLDEPNEVGIIENIKQLYRVMKSEKVNVVHAYTYYNSAFVMLAAFLSKVKVRITHSHRTNSNNNNSIVNKIYKEISKLLINIFSNIYLACSKEAGESLFYRYKKVEIINNGIDIEKFRYNKEIRDRRRKEFDILDECVVIGNVGRLDNNKNQSFLIDIFKEYCNYNQQSKLILIGIGENEKSLKLKAQEAKIDNKIMFLGNRSDVNEIYNMMDLFILTSFSEGLPFVLIEAQTNGLKCIVSDNVSKSSNITNSIKFESINKSASEWVDIIKHTNFTREDNIEKILKSGYNIKDTVKQLEEIYIYNSRGNV